MKVAELRSVIGGLSRELLEKLVVELYKALPKRIKDDKCIDDLVLDPEAAAASRRARSQTKPTPDIEDVRFEAEDFLENASKQYYFAPNRIVSKKDRAKWRFIAKRLHKQLIAAAADNEQQADAAMLLHRLFLMLCKACGVYLFSSTDPFRAVGIDQTRFLSDVIQLHGLSGREQIFVATCVDLALELEPDPETATRSLVQVVAVEFNTPDLREMAVTECARRAAGIRSKGSRGKDAKAAMGAYRRRDRLDRLATLSFHCQAALYDWNAAIKAHQTLSGERDKEVKLYILLALLRGYDEKSLWIREYERAVDNGVKPRDSLQKVYHGLRDDEVWAEIW